MDKKVLTKKLDRLVSILVRRSEDRCATCGKKLPWKYRQAGHFVPRVVQKTRWDLSNVHVQCSKCNVELGGNIPAYRIFMRNKYGDDFLAEIEDVYAMYKRGKLKAYSLDAMVELYNCLLEEARRLCPRDIPDGWDNIT